MKRRYIVQCFVCDYIIKDTLTGQIVHVFNSVCYAETCCKLMNDDYQTVVDTKEVY